MSCDVESSSPNPVAPTPATVVRRDSFKEQENFGDVESEAEEKEEAQTQLRHRRVRRSSARSSTSSSHHIAAGVREDGEGVSGNSTSTEDSSEASSRPSRPHVHHRHRTTSDIDRQLRSQLASVVRALASSDSSGLRRCAAAPGGFLDDAYRRRAWPRLAGMSMVESDVLPSQAECERHPEYEQVVMDVNRSLKRFPPGISDSERPALQDQLTRLIVRVLLKHHDLHYYQGYHDVAITFLLVVGEETGYHIMERLSTTHLRDFMAPTMEKTTLLLNYIYPLFEREDPELHDFLDASDVGTIFALPWVITWFGHVLPDYEDVVRLYDFFLSAPPLMPVYFTAALVLHRSKEVLLLEECEMASVHGLLSRIPTELPFEKLLSMAQEMYENYPPDSLEEEATIRMERMKASGKKIPDSRNALGLGTVAVVTGAVVVAPIVLGIGLWKWYNSSPSTS